MVEGHPLLDVVSCSLGGDRLRSLEIRTSPEDVDDNCFQVEHHIRARRRVFLGKCLANLGFLDSLREGGYRFTPHLNPKPGMVAADQVFRSPSLILEGESVSFGLVPDLEALAGLNRRGIRTALVMEDETLTYGILDHRVKGHVYFKQRPFPGFRLKKGEEVLLSYYLFCAEEEGYELHRRINSFLWERYGRPNLMRPGPQELPLKEGAGLAAEWAFLDEENWEDLRLEGGECGGVYSFNMNSRFPPRRRDKLTNNLFIYLPALYPRILQFGAAHITNHPLGFRLLRKALGAAPGTPPGTIQLQSWFNNVRSAYGALWLARDKGDENMAERAAHVRDLALLAPREKGFFPAVLYLVGDRMVWKKGTRAFFHLNKYHLADNCITAYHLLEWYRDLEADPAILEACHQLAGAVMEVQRPSGGFPAWLAFKRGRTVIDPCLDESAESAPSVMFLALMAELTGREDYLESARAGGDFLKDRVLEPNLWYDYEAFFSCSPKPVGWMDKRSGCYPECAMSIYWTAAAFLHLFIAGGEEGYLDAGRRALDRLLAHHQVWDPPFLSIDAFGGFASQNTDAEWNDARQGIIAPLLVDYYHACGDRGLFERGVATLQACFTTIHLDQEPFIPLRPSVRGSIAENYAHFGYDSATPGYLETDWGAGSSIYALARIMREHGQVYVDLPAGHAFGIDGCVVREMQREGDELSLGIESQLEGRRELEIVVAGAEGSLHLVVNGKDMGIHSADELRQGIEVRI
jgi:hypothetical protein